MLLIRQRLGRSAGVGELSHKGHGVAPEPLFLATQAGAEVRDV